ncbi:Hypothetical predicted protein [Lecanosticta acicola]|uniref:Uncharacterized protein n=1 Tax=Lecanosticta acicola TaxID=111012 RepID=A0AAI9EDB7_9PEZI|nr:Hypothetical predicted protein [Lecanosticta acicola]
MASALNSHLTPLGYDIVVATTQGALNATMLEYISESEDLPDAAKQQRGVAKCWIYKKNTTTKKLESVPIELKDLIALTPGINPFEIDANADPDSDVGLQRLRFAGFHCAYMIKPGLPPGIDARSMPNVIEIGNDSSFVTYNMLCSEVKVCLMEYMGMDCSWSVFEQPTGTSWGFQCQVDLRMSKDDSNSHFAQLPPEIQKQILADFGSEDSFSVQRLLFDLDNAGLEVGPAMKIFAGDANVDPIAQGLINGSFLNSYFADMKQRGQPLLHVAVVSHEPDESQFRATDMAVEACQLIDERTGHPLTGLTKDQQNLSTLNYLCMSNNNKIPQVQRPGWNWMNQAESHQFDGVISFQRNTFASYLRNKLQDQVKKNCYIASSKVVLDSGSIPQYYCGFKNIGTGAITNPSNRGDIKDWLNTQNGLPTFTLHEPSTTSDLVMEWNWKQTPASNDTAGSPVTLGSMTLQPSYSCQVHFRSNQIVITQNLTISLDLMKEQDSHSGNIVDWTLTDTYTLKVDAKGKLITDLPEMLQKGHRIDNSQTLGTNSFMNFFNSVDDVIENIKNSTAFVNTEFKDFPIDVAQKFQFPGGKTFAFRSFQFSKWQDLTAAITYLDPVAAPKN